MVFILDLCREVRREPRMARQDEPKKLGVESPKMASSPVISRLTNRDASLDDCLDVPKHATTIVLPADAKNEKDGELDETNTIPLLKKNKCKVHMCI